MSIKSFHTACAVLLTASCAFATAAGASAEETIDAFARAHLKASQAAQAAKDAGEAQAVHPAPGAVTAGPVRPDVPPELLFIYGVENTTAAYLRVDGRYGRNVTRGDKVGDWQVVAIGDDFVDVRRGAQRRRLLLPNTFGAAPALPEQTDDRSAGGRESPGLSHASPR
ncbi:hypothetical protein PMO31116_01410 [Pandoraea morbifera]|uniref:Type IV pilus biogenesis protein PilP n=1 Tax=Pandoraea morbifera TaxID=2508300 RepID=A0A5E4THD7_9BURK|nr:hypothetical protein [Pandoraea morbifera]VVD87265.1 hypothetical protein PMO31116_01410 [Pandoraea morbifera]